MITCDIDGTLLDYGAKPGEQPKINHALIKELAGRTDRIAIVSNQGGIPFYFTPSGGGKFPSPADFMHRLDLLIQALADAGVGVASVHVCICHPKALLTSTNLAREDLLAELDRLPADFPLTFVYDSPEHRKPSPLMLRIAGATVYYGDADEDRGAAEAMGIPFVRVERFTK